METKNNTKFGEKALKELRDNGYNAAIAVATDAEVAAGAACGQMATLKERENLKG